MSDETVKRLQAMSKEIPSLSEKIGDALVTLCGEPVQFYAMILTPNDAGAMLVTTAGMIDPENMEAAAIYFLQALATHGGAKVPGTSEAFTSMRQIHTSDKKH